MSIQRKPQSSLLGIIMAVAALGIPVSACAQAPTSAGSAHAHPELALTYDHVRSNAPVNNCGCFGLNGGAATFAWPLKSGSFALVGDVSVTHADAIPDNHYDLTISTFTAGLRYSPHFGHSHVHPFGQVLAGVAHASGSLVVAPSPAASNASAAFAANIGGGVDVTLHRHIALRLVEINYLLTRFDNAVNDHQNNIRIGTGLVFRF